MIFVALGHMLRLKTILSILTAAFISTVALSQSSTDSTAVLYGWKLGENYIVPELVDVDTSLENFQLHNVVFSKYKSVSTLGSYGSPYLANSFFQREVDDDLLFLNSYKDYFCTYENNLYINTRKPFTHLQYSQDWPKRNREEVLNAFHSQNVNEKLNIGFELNFLSDKAYYKYLNTSQKGFRLFSSYTGKSYVMHTSLNLNRFYAGENGGLVDTAYIPGAAFTHDYPTYFTGGGNTGSQPYKPYVTNKIRYMDAMVSQSFRLFSGRTMDSLKSSVSQPMVSHVFKIRRASKIYENTAAENNSYYDNIFTNEGETYDSVGEYKLSNTIQLDFKTKLNKKILAGVYANINHEYVKNSFYSLLDTSLVDSSYAEITEVPTMDQGNYYARKSRFNTRGIANYDGIYDINNTNTHSNIFVSGGIYGKFWTHFESRFNGLLYISGYKAGETKLDGIVKTNVVILKRPYQLYVEGALENIKPAYQHNNYYSNHYIMENEYGFINKVFLSSKLAAPSNRFELEANYALLNNYIYLNDSNFVAHKAPISVSSLSIDKEFVVWKLHSYNKLTYQVSENRSVIEIPAIIFFNSTYIDNTWLFKLTGGQLRTMLGVDIYYNSAFSGYAYNPALASFYQSGLESKSETIGNYPYIDVWANVRLKRARFFIKYEHINRTTDNIDHYYAVNYPSKISRLKFGLSWTFYN